MVKRAVQQVKNLGKALRRKSPRPGEVQDPLRSSFDSEIVLSDNSAIDSGRNSAIDSDVDLLAYNEDNKEQEEEMRSLLKRNLALRQQVGDENPNEEEVQAPRSPRAEAGLSVAQSLERNQVLMTMLKKEAPP